MTKQWSITPLYFRLFNSAIVSRGISGTTWRPFANRSRDDVVSRRRCRFSTVHCVYETLPTADRSQSVVFVVYKERLQDVNFENGGPSKSQRWKSKTWKCRILKCRT